MILIKLIMTHSRHYFLAGPSGLEPETSSFELYYLFILNRVIGLSYRRMSDPFCKLSLAHS